MLPSLSLKQDDPRYLRQLTSHGVNMEPTIFLQQRIHSLATIFSLLLQPKLRKTALSKAVSITRRNKKEKETITPSSRKEGQRNDRFFRGGPPAKYGGRQGKSFFLYNPHPFQNREREYNRGRNYPNYSPFQRQGQKPSTTSQSCHKTTSVKPNRKSLKGTLCFSS